ncbi:MAG: NAD(P)-dependent oxidoreductase [Clostridiales bacterium]|nr:NAD(P)-dependent oxidoreductase [Clostridiales bacterium]
MSKDIGENIFDLSSDFMTIGLLSSKVKVLVIGGGRAGFIKAKSFAMRGCKVTVLSLDFDEEFTPLAKKFNIQLIKAPYSSAYIDSYHIVVIALGVGRLIKEIKKACQEKFKLYLDCSDYQLGNLVIPSQASTKNISYTINTRAASPITSQFLMEGIRSYLSNYDDLVDYLGSLRKALKGNEKLKEIMAFTSSEDFNFFFKKGYGDIIIKLFYGDLGL